MVGVNADNYMDYLGAHSADAVNVTRENILYYPPGRTPLPKRPSASHPERRLNALGTNAAVVSLSAASYDWTVSTGGSELGEGHRPEPTCRSLRARKAPTSSKSASRPM